MNIESRPDRIIISLIVNICSWILLVTYRYKRFTIPRLLGTFIMNLYITTTFYLFASIVVNEGYMELYIYLFLLINDTLFSLVYSMLNFYIFPSGLIFFCFFPKICLSLCLYFYYDDKLGIIFKHFIITTLINICTAIVSEEIILDCAREKIEDEFGILEYFVFLYLDLYYIGYKLKLNCIETVKDIY